MASPKPFRFRYVSFGMAMARDLNILSHRKASRTSWDDLIKH